MTDSVSPDLLGQCPLFAGHAAEELADIAQYMRPIQAAAGTRLFAQGADAEGMYFVEEGRVRIVSRLPGDRVVELGRIGPGELFGEVALVIHSQHSTTAEVVAPFKGCFFSRMHFEMLRNDLRPAAFRTMNAITHTLCGRIRSQIAEIQGSLSRRPESARAAGRARNGRARSGHDLRLDPTLLRALPLFQPYGERELKAFLAPLKPRSLPRGAVLYRPGDAPRRCFLVVRGALRLSVTRGGAAEQLAVLGPGQLAGDLALMDGLPQAALCDVREDATVLEMPRARFDALRAGGDPLAFKFFESVNRSLVGKLRRNNRTLALLAVQGRTRSAPRQGT
jgi:CRP-like cAMP-binding protein